MQMIRDCFDPSLVYTGFLAGQPLWVRDGKPWTGTFDQATAEVDRIAEALGEMAPALPQEIVPISVEN